MNILVLDDDPSRLRAFKFELGSRGHLVRTVINAPETIEALAHETFDVAFLDHDLRGVLYEPSGPGTGYEVACWLEENPDRCPPRVFVHSLNGPGAQRMVAAIGSRATHEPFAWARMETIALLASPMEADARGEGDG